MAVYIDDHDQLHLEQASSLALTCPHCMVFSHLTPQAVPRFAELSSYRPAQVGIVFRCDACASPVFLRFAVRGYHAQRIELSPQFTEVERPKEKFSFTYLPGEVEVLFREGLMCYSNAAFNAFATMARRTMQAVFAHLGEAGKLRIFDQLNDVRDMAEIASSDFALVKRVIFDTDAEPYPSLPLLDDDQSALLLEVMKDLLYQAYVRKGRLQQAMLVRRFFSEQSERPAGLVRPPAPGSDAGHGELPDIGPPEEPAHAGAAGHWDTAGSAGERGRRES